MPRLFEIAPARTGGRQTGGSLRPFLRLHGPCERAGADAFFSEGKEKTNEKAHIVPADGLCDGRQPAACLGPGSGNCELCQRICSYVCKRQL